MNTQKQVKSEGYFDDLSTAIKALVQDACIETMENNNEFWSDIKESVKNIPCVSEPGFIPSSHNHGGIVVRTFIDLMSIWSNGNYPKHKDARAEIERQIEFGLNHAQERFFENNKEVLEKHNVGKDMIDYHTLQKLAKENPELRGFEEEFSEYERENLDGDDSSIMYEVRFMYHGKVNGIHSASVSCAVNTEGPYHRSNISWAPGVFCEGSKEVEFTWLTVKELERELKTALSETSKAIF